MALVELYHGEFCPMALLKKYFTTDPWIMAVLHHSLWRGERIYWNNIFDRRQKSSVSGTFVLHLLISTHPSPTPTLLFRFLLLISSTRLLLLLYFLFFSSISPSLFLFIFLIVFAILSGGFHRFRFNWRIGRLKAGNLRIPLNTSVKGDGERCNWLYYQSLSNKSN